MSEKTRLRRTSVEMSEHCSWPGCAGRDSSHGFCRTHYARARYSVEFEHLIPEESRAPRCSKPDCGHPAYARDLCRNHFEMLRRSGTDRVNKPIRDTHVNDSRLQIALVVRGVKVQELMSRLGRSNPWLTRARRTGMSRSDAEIIADALDVSVDWLLDPSLPVIEGLTVRD